MHERIERMIMFFWQYKLLILFLLIAVVIVFTFVALFNRISALEVTFNEKAIENDRSFVEIHERAYQLYNHMKEHCKVLGLHERILKELYNENQIKPLVEDLWF